MKLFHRTMGHGRPLVILHGLLGMSDNWISIGRSLAEYYNVWIPDQRNHGRSPHHEEHTYEALAEDLKLFLHQHSIEKPILVGHSMGGKAAMHFAAQYPESLSSLVVVDIAPVSYLDRTGSGRQEHRIILNAMAGIDLSLVKTRTEAENRLSEAIHSPRIRQFILKNLSRNEQDEFSWLCNVPVLLKSLNHIMGSAGQTMTPWLSPRTLFVRGALSDYISPADEGRIRSLFPDAGIVTIQGAGHWVHAEAPKEFLDTLLGFLQETS
ncbi:MAG: alpha/beta fold hydrolase [Bacteroidales bacterium]